MSLTRKEVFRLSVLRLLREARGLMFLYQRETLKENEDIDGKHMTIGARDVTSDEPSDARLPDALKGRWAQKSHRRWYWVLKHLRDRVGPVARVTLDDLLCEWPDLYPNTVTSLDGLKKGMTALRKRRVAFPSAERGWGLVDPQGVLISGTHSENVPAAGDVGYASRVGRDRRGRVVREWPMNETAYIWVPVEEDSGMVRDAVTDRLYPPAGEGGELRFETITGKQKVLSAVRAELKGIEGEGKKRRAVVLIRDRDQVHEVHTPVLGEWHLAGEPSPPREASVA